MSEIDRMMLQRVADEFPGAVIRVKGWFLDGSEPTEDGGPVGGSVPPLWDGSVVIVDFRTPASRR